MKTHRNDTKNVRSFGEPIDQFIETCNTEIMLRNRMYIVYTSIHFTKVLNFVKEKPRGIDIKKYTTLYLNACDISDSNN